MSILEIYELKREEKPVTAKKPMVTGKLPDETNLAVVNGILVIVDSTNDVVISVDDVIHELDKLTEMMYVKNGSSANAVFASLNFFTGLKEEFETNDN